MKIEFKLASLIALALFCVALLAGMLWYRAYTDYSSLKRFNKIAQLVIRVSEVMISVTNEKHKGWAAVTLRGKGTPESQIQNYRDDVDASDAKIASMEKAIAEMDLSGYSQRFQQAVREKLAIRDRLETLRRHAFARDIDYQLIRVDYEALLDRLLDFFSILSPEATDAELIRRIVAQENIVRLKVYLYTIRGSVGSGIKNRGLDLESYVLLRENLRNAENLIAHVRGISSPELLVEVEKLVSNPAVSDLLRIAHLFQGQEAAERGTIDYVGEADADLFEAAKVNIVGVYDDFLAFVANDVQIYTERRMEEAKGDVRFYAGVGLVNCLIFVILGLWISRSIARPISEVSMHLIESSHIGSETASLVAQYNQSLADEATQQAASIQEISSSLEEISGMTRSSLDTIDEALKMGDAAKNAADSGAQEVVMLNTAMADINKSSSEITAIIKTIEEIAFQTNILALNAAVEAARAGEAGAGFAVVAEEVRNLAQRSAKAANESASKIRASINSSQRGTEISRRMNDRLAEIVRISHGFNDLLQKIVHSSSEQNTGIQHINEAVSHLDSFTQSTAANAEQTASSTEEMKQQTEIIREQVRVLENMIWMGSRQDEHSNH
jgi:methyl-accepting chemotaxis protein